MTVQIQFLGAAGTVTGSKYLVSYQDKKILIDAGMFQGSRDWREKNWADLTFKPSEITAVCLTHAHIDHSGILPRFVELGLNCPVHCTPGTADLTKILLTDSAKLQEQEVEYRSARGKSRHKPVLPLYTAKGAESANQLIRPSKFYKRIEVATNVYATFIQMGHILGAAAIQLEIGGKLITFSGDIGRYNVPILVDPQQLDYGDLLLIESTYGDREHAAGDPKLELADVINRTYKRSGVVVIPSFAVGRAQLLLYYLRELKAQSLIPDLPVIIDSPMANDATEVYQRHPGDYDEQAINLLSSGKKPFSLSKLAFTQEVAESIKLNTIDQPMILISASGMLSGGRILHHLKHRISDPRNTILFVGFQPAGGRGAWIQSGAKSLRLFGDEYEIRAEIAELSGLSAHADKNEMLRWCKACKGRPTKTAVVHGESDSAAAFADTLHKEFDWNTFVPKYQEILAV